MADASSVIRVSIIGDASKLTGALDKGQSGIKGFVGKAGIALGGLFAVDKAFDFIKGSLDQTDRMNDAIGRLQGTLGKTDEKKIEDIAGNFHKLGLSAPDVLELSASFADIATNIGIAAPKITDVAPELAGLAETMQLAGADQGKDAAAIIVDIAKAAGGANKPLQSLGINLSDAAVAQQAMKDTGKSLPGQLTESEKATARLELITANLRDRFGETADKTADLETKQHDLQAQVETLQAKLGGPLSDALSSVVGFILDEIDAIPGAIEGWKSLGGAIVDMVNRVAAPLGNLNDLIGQIGTNLGLAADQQGKITQNAGDLRRRQFQTSDSATVRALQRTTERRGGIGNSLGGP